MSQTKTYFIARMMQEILAYHGEDVSAYPVGQIEKDISLMQTIEKVTAEEFYNAKKMTTSINFDKLPISRRAQIGLEVRTYLRARDLYEEISHSLLDETGAE
ncbi:MAG: hypothetical protein K0R00_123 [Herbinix sp.]|jgi:hypothetical protein|nr:hypothetical protein [Herbinix sp.]